jgi:hypothetical protein
MRRAIVLAAALSVPGVQVMAMTDMDVFQLANELATVIASEAVCGLQYDQAAISGWIEKNVPADRSDFAPQLQIMTAGQDYQLGEMSASARTAHCAAVSRSARHMGFMP